VAGRHALHRAALAAFTVLFGTRHLDTTERHEGMVAAIAFESVVKLLAFLAVGIYVTYWLYDGFGDLYARAAAVPELQRLLAFDGAGRLGYGGWFAHVLLAMLSVIFLPRQFQIAVVENVNEQHLRRATWVFPAYLLAINIFVIPIAIGGLLHFGQGTVDPDTFVLTLPLAHGQRALALLVFIGGLSAATGMVIVEAIALSTMVCNDLVMPMLLRSRRLDLARERDLTGLLLGIRRGAIVVILLLLGYLYFRLAGEAYALVSIGLISFAAVAQFAPVVIGGMYWRGGTREGALAGLLAGFAVWVYTLLLPSFAKSGWLDPGFLEHGVFGLAGSSPSSSSASPAWTTSATRCSGACSPTSAATCWCRCCACRPGRGDPGRAVRRRVPARRRAAGELLAHRRRGRRAGAAGGALPRPAPHRGGLRRLRALARAAAGRAQLKADPELVHFAETLLAGAIGSASARVMVSTVVQEEPLGLGEVMDILDEASQVRAYSHKLEEKSRALEAATAELRAPTSS
jgi:hypothetical protein